MAEKNENDKLTSLTEKVDKITEYINQDIQAKEQAKKEQAEKEAREELKNELKEEIAKEFTNEVVPSIAKIFNEAWDVKFKEMVGDRTHIQQSATGTTKPEDVKENSVVQIIEQRQSDPKYSILENHKSVVMGQTVKGYTPTEMFNLDS